MYNPNAGNNGTQVVHLSSEESQQLLVDSFKRGFYTTAKAATIAVGCYGLTRRMFNHSMFTRLIKSKLNLPEFVLRNVSPYYEGKAVLNDLVSIVESSKAGNYLKVARVSTGLFFGVSFWYYPLVVFIADEESKLQLSEVVKMQEAIRQNNEKLIAMDSSLPDLDQLEIDRLERVYQGLLRSVMTNALGQFSISE